MKKICFFLAMTLISVFAIAQAPNNLGQAVWVNGKVMYTAIPSIDSITYTNKGVTRQDTLHLLMPRTTVRVRHETVTVYKHDTVYIDTCVIDNKIGKFPVSADKQVSFAKGNLQYQASSKTWRFAEHQYDYIGAANSNISDTYDGWIDLFGWGTSSNPTNASTDNTEYATFVDWGTNTIGADAPGTWRAMTLDEWRYLFKHVRWTMAKVNDVLGFVLLPDDAAVDGITLLGDGNDTTPNYGRAFKESDYASNVYTAAEFAKMETQGCVFLPAAGYRQGTKISDVEKHGYYWTTTPYKTGEENAYFTHFYSTNVNMNTSWFRSLGFSVRLVQDVK